MSEGAGRHSSRATRWRRNGCGVTLGLMLAGAAGAPAVAQSSINRLGEGHDALRRGDLPRAISAFEEAARLNPRDPRTAYGLCVARLRLGEMPRAAEDCSRAIRLDPRNPEPYYLRGLIRSQEMGDLSGGIGDFDRAIQLKPDHAAAHLKRGNARVRLGDMPAGRADYDRAIALDPSWADAYYNRGVVRYQLQDRRGAVKDLRRAAQLFREQGDHAGHDRARKAAEQVEAESR